MKQHFQAERWADLVRNVISDRDRAEMESHLSRGCESCKSEFQAWSRVASISRDERKFEPPQDALHMAKTQLALQRPEPTSSGIRDIAALVMDSFSAPAMAGVRSRQSSSRQLLYQQGSCVIDVRVELKPSSSKLNIIGQVQDSQMVESDFKKVSVCVLTGNSLVMHTTTSNTGEFHLEIEAVEKLSLQVGLEGRSIVLPVPDLSLTAQAKRT